MNESIKVKNFGPIKSIDLQIKKVNVLIGEQGTGKSTLAKLISICKEFELIVNHKNGIDIFRNFSIDTYFQTNTVIDFKSDFYSLNIKNEKISIKYSVELKQYIVKHNEIREKIRDEKNTNKLTTLIQEQNELRRKIHRLTGIYSFIPAERMLNSLITEGAFSLDKTRLNFPRYILDFGEHFGYAKKRLRTLNLPFGGYKFLHNTNGDFIQISDVKIVKYTEASSGILSVIPMLAVVIDQSASDKYPGIFVIEEPELNLFPKAQNQILREIVSSCIKHKDSLFLTTHSPYILTSLNNLLYAFSVGKIHPRKVNSIVENKYWLNPDDVNALMLSSDGKVIDIFNREEGLIRVDMIDGISKDINIEFDKLVDIEIGTTV